MTLRRAFWMLLLVTLAVAALTLWPRSTTVASTTGASAMPMPAERSERASIPTSTVAPDASPSVSAPMTEVAASAPAATSGAACVLPPRVAHDAPPLQTALVGGPAPITVADARLLPLAGFSVEARVLGREDYRHDREARYAPLDLALGWGRMTDDAVLARLQIRQSGRWYRYSWQGQPPIPLDEIVRSSANMHMIPADAAVADALSGIDKDDRVRIDGWLVEVQADDGWRWRSSLTREDQGQGACEVVYVCAVRLQ